jgi:hypothetical protein
MTSRRAAPRPRTVLAAALATVAVGAAAVVGVTSPAQAEARCDGVWVVVDAQSAGGPITTGCAAGDPANGLAALEDAGHRFTFVRPGMPMVCTIDGRPDPCNGAPSEAHWSYWHADAGGSWTYSSQGAGSRDPEPGQVEGWAFGAGDPPRVAPPDAAPEPEPSPTPTASPNPSPRPSPTPTAEPAPTTGASASPPASTSPDPAPSTETDDTDEPEPSEPPPTDADEEEPTAVAAPPPRPGPTPTTDPGSPGADERPAVELRDTDGNDEVAVGRPGDGGAMAGLIAGSALAAAIAGGGVFQVRRRRRELGP